MKLLCEIVLAFALLNIISVFGHKRDHFDLHHKKHEGHKHHRPQGDLKIHLAEEGTARNETVVIDVVRKQSSQNGPKTKLKVNLRIHVIQGNIHVNGHKIDHAVVTSVHLNTRLDTVYESGVVKSEPAFVYVRVMVTESTNANGVKMLSVQEEIVQINGEAVNQMDIKEIVLELGDNVNESKRTITTINVSKSKIHGFNKMRDTHIWACEARRGQLPHHPFHADRNKMTKWKHVPHSHKRPPHFELGRNRDHDFGRDDDNDDDDDDDDNKDDGKHHHHKHGFKYWRHRFCKWFHSLPVATRAIFCISTIFFTLLLIGSCCCCCCCRKTKKQAPEIQKKYELSDVACEDDEEASPLPTNKALDKQPLVA